MTSFILPPFPISLLIGTAKASIFRSLLQLTIHSATTTHPPSRPPDAPVGRSSKTSLGFISTPLIWPVRKKPETIVTQTSSHSTVPLTKPSAFPKKNMTNLSPISKHLEGSFIAKTTRKSAYSHVLLSHNRTDVALLGNRKKKPMAAHWDPSEENMNSSETHDYTSDSSSEEIFYDIDFDEDVFRLMNIDASYSLGEGLATVIPLKMSVLESASVHSNTSTTPPKNTSKSLTRRDDLHNKSNFSLPWTEVVYTEMQSSSRLISDLGVTDVKIKQPEPSRLIEQTIYNPSTPIPLPSPVYKTMTSHLLKYTEVTQGWTVTSEAYGRGVMIQTTHDFSTAVSHQHGSYQTDSFTKWPTLGSYSLITKHGPTPALPYFSTTPPRLFDDSPQNNTTLLEEHSLHTSLISPTEVPKGYKPSEADYWTTSNIFYTSIQSSFQLRTESLHILYMFSSFSDSIYDPRLLSAATQRKITSDLGIVTEDQDLFFYPSLSSQFLSTVQSESSIILKYQDFYGLITPTRRHIFHNVSTSSYTKTNHNANEYNNYRKELIQVENSPNTLISMGTDNVLNNSDFHNKSVIPTNVFGSMNLPKSLITPVPTVDEYGTRNDAMSLFSKPAGGFHFDIIFPHKQSRQLVLDSSTHIFSSYLNNSSISRNQDDDLLDTTYAQFSTAEMPFSAENESAKSPDNTNNMIFVRPASTDEETHSSHPASDNQSLVPVNGTLPLTIPSKKVIAYIQFLPTGTTYGTTTDSAEFDPCPCKAHFHNSCLCGLSAGNSMFSYNNIDARK